MPLVHDFKETIGARAQRDAKFRHALLREAVECIINGDVATGKAVLLNAAIRFSAPRKAHKGNPSAANLSRLLTAIQKTEGVRSGFRSEVENRPCS
jgi:hypothetical protein